MVWGDQQVSPKECDSLVVSWEASHSYRLSRSLSCEPKSRVESDLFSFSWVWGCTNCAQGSQVMLGTDQGSASSNANALNLRLYLWYRFRLGTTRSVASVSMDRESSERQQAKWPWVCSKVRGESAVQVLAGHCALQSHSCHLHPPNSELPQVLRQYALP